MKTKKSLTNILPVLFGFFIMGFCDIVGISSDYAKDSFKWSNTMAGFIPSMVFVWFLFLSIPVGVKMNKWGRKNTVLLSMIVTVIGMILPLIHYNSATCMSAYALLGIGNAILQVSLNPLLGNVISDNKLLTSSLTAGQVVKAISSFVGPYFVLIAVKYLGNNNNELWYYVFPILGLITLISGFWLLVTPIEKEKNCVSESNTYSETLKLLKDKTILLLFLGIFFIVGIDVATNFISSKIMINRFMWSNEEASIAPQIYFICRTVGAFLGAFLMTKIAEIKYFRFNIVSALIVVLILILFSESIIVNLVSIGLIGFLCSCIFPIIYSMAVQARPEKQNQISGLMITAVAGGGAITPILGFATDSYGITGGVSVLVICVLYLIYCAFGVKYEYSKTVELV